MIARLGNVLYWAACGAAVLLGALGAFEFFVHKDSEAIVVFAVLGLLVWLVGRACRYILAGR